MVSVNARVGRLLPRLLDRRRSRSVRGKLLRTIDQPQRGGLGISAGSVVNPFIRIGGTLAEPTVALDKTGALITGGAAFFTAGLSLIAKAAFDAAWRSPDPCGRVLEEAEKRFAKENGG